MMFLPICILAIIQGITEFLPISSSGHLVLVHHAFAGLDNLSPLEQKQMDIAVHIGTLLAVIGYFWRDFIALIIGGVDILRFQFKTDRAKQSLWILVASIPVMICGVIITLIDVTMFDSMIVIAWTSIIFGILLYIADKRPETPVTLPNAGIKSAIIYGVMQCIALIPGVSRSGITMTAGRFLGHDRVSAARISMMMGMVTILAAGALTGASMVGDVHITPDFIQMIGIGITLSFITAYIAILLMMRWFSNTNGSMTPFVIYRVILGMALLIITYI